MREPIAVLSDIHGNVRALDAVLGEIRRRGISRVVNLGDSLYGPFDPRPVADLLITLGVLSVSGNEDRVLLEAHPASRTARFTREQLEPRHLAWLQSLPRTAVVGSALLCHGTPTDDGTYLLSAIVSGVLLPRPSEDVAALAGAVAQPLVLCGHDHTPRALRASGRHFINPGSVGCPAYTDDHPELHVVEMGSPDARCALVTPSADGFAVEWIAVSYAAAGAAAEARANGFSDWATWIATGRARSQDPGS